MDRVTTVPAAEPADIRLPAPRLSARALSTPEPLVRAFARRVQQEGALDLTQGDYKNADFAPHPEVVRAAQRITRNTVHSYGPCGRRMDVPQRNRGVLQPRRAPRLPSSDVRFLPDEVIFTSGTRSGLATVLEVLGGRRHGCRRAAAELGIRLVRRARREASRGIADRPAGVPARPEQLERLLAGGGSRR